MATYSKLPSGTWRVQARTKGRYISETFLKRDDARRWAVENEARIDRGETPTPQRAARLRTFGELIDLHIADMKEVGKAPRRSKAATLKMLKARLGRKNLVTGHKDWKMLRRYTHLRPEALHAVADAIAA